MRFAGRSSGRALESSLVLAALAAGAVALPVRADDADRGLPIPAGLARRDAPPHDAPAAAVPPLRTVLAPDLEGSWRVRGRHVRLGIFAGSIQITATSRGLRYERRTRYDTAGVQEVEQGSAALSGGTLTTQEDRAPATSGFAAVARGDGAAGHSVRTTTYRSTGRDRYEGAFAVEGVAPGDRGVETIEKGRLAEDSFALLVDGKEAFSAFREAFGEAQRSIDVQSYIWSGDETGTGIADLLIEKARQGVEIRVLQESMGVERGADKLMDRMRAAGIQTIVQNQWYKGLGHTLADLGRGLWSGIKSLFGGGGSAKRESRGVTNHDHRKVIVVDGRTGFVGGMNLAHEYEARWHDIHCRVAGPVVDTLQEAFLERWRAAGGPAPRDRSRLFHDRTGEAPAGDTQLQVITALPGISQEIKETYLREIGRARRRILIENAYFLDDDVIHAIQARVRAGVPATVIVPDDEHNDVKLVRDAFEFIQNDLVKSGVDLRKYRGRMVHSKVAAIDGQWSTVGSSNLDNVALARLAELNVASQDPRIAQTLERRVFAVDVPGSEKVVEKKLSFWKKMKGGVLHFFRSFL